MEEIKKEVIKKKVSDFAFTFKQFKNKTRKFLEFDCSKKGENSFASSKYELIFLDHLSRWHTNKFVNIEHIVHESKIDEFKNTERYRIDYVIYIKEGRHLVPYYVEISPRCTHKSVEARRGDKIKFNYFKKKHPNDRFISIELNDVDYDRKFIDIMFDQLNYNHFKQAMEYASAPGLNAAINIIGDRITVTSRKEFPNNKKN